MFFKFYFSVELFSEDLMSSTSDEAMHSDLAFTSPSPTFTSTPLIPHHHSASSYETIYSKSNPHQPQQQRARSAERALQRPRAARSGVIPGVKQTTLKLIQMKPATPPPSPPPKPLFLVPKQPNPPRMSSPNPNSSSENIVRGMIYYDHGRHNDENEHDENRKNTKHDEQSEQYHVGYDGEYAEKGEEAWCQVHHHPQQQWQQQQQQRARNASLSMSNASFPTTSGYGGTTFR